MPALAQVLPSHAEARDDRPAIATQPEAGLAVQSLAIGHAAVTLLRDVNFLLPQASYGCLLGQSGSGKSTLLASLAGLVEPSSGEIRVDGQPVFSRARKLNVPPERRQLGMVFQDPTLWPHLSVLENVLFPLRARSRRIDRRIGLDLLERVGLAAHAQRRPHQLSGGQRQRVAIVRALIAKPRLVLLDEPLSAVDGELREDLRAFLKELFREHHITALHVTHDPQEAFELGANVGVLAGGGLAQWDTPEALYSRPASAAVARLTGLASLLEVEVLAREEGMARISLLNQTLVAPAHAQVRPGPGLLMLRPEAVHIGVGDFSAQAVRERYQGERRLVDLQLADGQKLQGFAHGPAVSGTQSFHIESRRGWTLPAAR